MLCSAEISDCGRYRYRLDRVWGDEDGARVCWVMLNPSTADSSKDDPTIRRCISFSKAWKAHGLTVVNLFALRSTSPAGLLSLPLNEAIGPGNNDVLAYVTRRTRVVFCAWGSSGSGLLRRTIDSRADDVARILRHRKIWCLGTTKDGAPRHPLYLPMNSRPRIWEAK